jgi:hypothetical protein
MAYIRTDEVKEIRNTLKEEFGPDLKFGVKKESGGIAVRVTLKKGNVDFSDITGREGERGYAQINQYHLSNYGDHRPLFEDIINVIKKAPGKAEGGREWFDKSDAMVDYFHTAFYFNLNVGNFDKPYEYEG